MDNLSKILDAIYAEGRAEAAEILKAGTRRAENLLKQYREEAEKEEAAILEKARRQAAELIRRTASRADIEGRRIRLQAKRRALQGVFSQALADMAKLSNKEKQDLYTRLIGKYAAGKDAVLTLNRADARALGKKLIHGAEKEHGIKITLDTEAGGFLGGLILRQGKVETNCTFEALI